MSKIVVYYKFFNYFFREAGELKMIYTIISAKNEGRKIEKTLRMILNTSTDKILVVINGCTDDTYDKVNSFNNCRINTIYFNKSLGIDVPRSIGAYFAYREGAKGFIFMDGDMSGDISKNIDELIDDLRFNKIDLGLTDCYPNINYNGISNVQLAFRKQLNLELGIFHKIGYATPSHGPHGISRKLLRAAGFKNIAIPPIILSIARLNYYNIKISTTIENIELESTIKDEFHSEQIIKTIIGDSIQALNIYRKKPPLRGFNGNEFLGYHKNRRFDILDMIIN